jgi:transcriptional regulator GlxA family with amidase domain
MLAPMAPRRVVFVAFDGFQSLDLVGPHAVFHHAGVAARAADPPYDLTVAARAAGPVRANSGLPVHASHGLADVPVEGIDTLVVVGGPGVDAAARDAALVGWVATAGRRARRVTSVCSGAFLLAAAGLLDGRRVTTHWSRAEQLRREHPALTVDTDPIFIREGRVWTSAGVTAGMDLALALVEDDLGHEVAHAVACELVLHLRRPGNQSQFSVPLWDRQPVTDPVRAAVAAVHADPGGRHGIADLARQAGLSPRHLQRRFTAELGVPPAAWVERARVEAAQRALLDGDEGVDVVARRCGFGTAETLRRAFHRHLGIPPSAYRDRFRSTPAPAPAH